MRKPKLLGLPLPSLAGERLGPIPGAYVPAYLNLILANSPQAYWKCNDASGNPVDSSGNGNNMTTSTGTPQYRVIRGPLSSTKACIRLIGGSSLTKSAPVSTATNNFTMELWVIPELIASSNADVIYNGNAGSNGWGIIIDTDLTIQFSAGGVVIGANSATRLNASVWNHLVVARDANQWKYWINGVLDTATLGTNTPNAPSGGLSGFRSFASRQIVVAHLAIYDSVLTLAQIQTRYNAAKRGSYGVTIS